MPGPGPGVHPGKMKPAHQDGDGWSRGRGGVAEVTPSAVDKWLSVDNRMVKSFRRVLRNARMVDCKTASPVVGIDRYQGSTPSMLAEVAAPPGGGTACPSIYRSAPERSDSSVRSPPARFHLARPRRRYSLYPWSPPDRPHPAHPGPLAMPRCQRGVVTQAQPESVPVRIGLELFVENLLYRGLRLAQPAEAGVLARRLVLRQAFGHLHVESVGVALVPVEGNQ